MTDPDKEMWAMCDLDSDGETTAPQQPSVFILCGWIGKQEYYILLKRETGLLPTDIHGWTRRQVSLIWVGADSREQSSDSRYLREDSRGGHFLLTLLTFALPSEEGLAIPVGLTQVRLCHTHETEALGSWTWHAYFNNTFSIRILLTLYRERDWHMMGGG